MRVIALLAVYNEERFIAGCLDHLIGQGAEVYLLDNGSTDQTRAIAEHYRNRGLVGIEAVPRGDVMQWQRILKRKDELSTTLDADWFMHVDADEIHLPTRSGRTLAHEFAEIEAEGYDAVNFVEFTFMPTRETPDHDHPDFQQTMRWYYPFVPLRPRPHLVRAWKRRSEGVGLDRTGGHQLRFPGMRLYPTALPMRHYLFLSIPHAQRKYGLRHFAPEELARGWHGWRGRIGADLKAVLPSENELRRYISDDLLDAANPRTTHYIEDWAALAGAGEASRRGEDVS